MTNREGTKAKRRFTRKERAEFVGLVGFVVSGVLFSVSAAINRDHIAFAGSVIWTGACIVWIVALFAAKG